MPIQSSPLLNKMIFLVGARRSGTNWLERIIGAHPGVSVLPSETALFTLGIEPLLQRFHHSALGSPRPAVIYMDRGEMIDAIRDLCDAAFASGMDVEATQRLLERSPDHVRALSLIAEVYPDARTVHIIRDGRDVARSLVSQPWGPSTVGEAALEWRTAVEMGRRASQDIDHYIEVRYEDLLADPRPRIVDLFDRLDLPASDAVIEHALAEADVRFNVDAGIPVVGTAKWRASFTATDIEAFNDHAGALLAELGYEASTGPPAPSVNSGLRPRRKRIRARRHEDLVRRSRERVHRNLQVVDAFLEALHTADTGRLVGLLSSTASVRVIGTDDDRVLRGEEASDLLQRVVAADDVLRGTQVRGDVHPSVPMFTFVGVYRATDGALHGRVTVLRIADDLVESCIYYRFALLG